MRATATVQDLRLPLAEGARIQILTTRDRDDPDALFVLRHSAAHLLAEAARRLHPARRSRSGPPIENGFYYDFEFPEPIGEEDLAALEAEIEREIAEGRTFERWEVERDEARRIFTRKARRTRSSSSTPPTATSRSTGRAISPISAAAPTSRTRLRSRPEADLARRRLLARRRAEHAADPGLRDGVLRQEGSRGSPRADRGGEAARPSPPRPGARPRPFRRALARLAALASAGHGHLEPARGPPPAARTRSAATSR